MYCNLMASGSNRTATSDTIPIGDTCTPICKNYTNQAKKCYSNLQSFFFLHKIQCVFFLIFWLNGMREMHEIDVTLLWTRFFLLCLARFVFYSSFLLSPRVHFFWCVFRLFIPLGCFLLAYYCILLFPVESQHQE